MMGAQRPRPGIRALAAVCVWLMTAGVSPAQGTWEMPNLIGKTLNNAYTEIFTRDHTALVYLELEEEEFKGGNGPRVSGQEPKAGTKLTKGETVHLTVKPIAWPEVSCEVLLWLLGVLTATVASFAVWQRLKLRRLEDLLKVPDRP